MCRIYGYVGSVARLDHLVLVPDHALVHQSVRARELPPDVVCTDGFGIAWYSDESSEPAAYRTDRPMCADKNFRDFAGHVRSPCVIAGVRAATQASAVNLANTLPFTAGSTLGFALNGELQDFAASWQRDLRASLSPACEAEIVGTSDSEHVFALLRDVIEDERSVDALVSAMQRVLLYLEGHARAHGKSFAANLLLTNGRAMVASRTATFRDAPSLYVFHGEGEGGSGTFIASEPAWSSDGWRPVPQDVLVVADGRRPPRQVRMARADFPLDRPSAHAPRGEPSQPSSRKDLAC